MATSNTKKTQTAKKPQAAKADPVVDEEVVSGEIMTDAELEREEELAREDLLEDMPELLDTRRFRLRHKNQLKEIYFRYKTDLDKARDVSGSDKEMPPELGLRLEAMAGEIDMFAQTIAFDAEAYEDWAVENSSDVAVFVALLTKLMGALGE